MDDRQTMARNIIVQNTDAMQEIIELYQDVVNDIIKNKTDLNRLSQLIEAINRLDQKVQQELKTL